MWHSHSLSPRRGERAGVRGSDRARELRRNQTDAEAQLWRHIRDRRLVGFKFRRQCPVGCYIVDFLCIEHRLVVEVDGGQHGERRAYDEQRSAALRSLGFRVLRYWNDDVLLRTDAVLQDLVTVLTAPHPSPLPARGEREQT